ncbi:carbohydrate ABC transporter permease [Phototrophicus methaneseepsis]|uniref:Carbohydrate ABC transporter permease n=1 Tax=Phototrophicus methaneseepsis TaxID=2710758 RepID=A0A7S8ICT7_9CHLR|nr:carbohydrate ABC transporter permease [Phototrophicus methaneseepsis]QPC80821.1 carbohydrate ABC transporter permease [Phototrophicus methaneseepsis]
MRRKSHVNPLSVILLHIVVISGALITVTPLLWMVYSSFKSTSEIFRYPPWLPPETWSLANYASLLDGWYFEDWYLNSVLYSGAQTLLTLFFCSLAGFAFAKYTFRGKNILFALLVSSTLIPFQLILIPLFIQMSQIGWVNTPYAMVVPWVAPAFGIFLMRQFALSIPTELLEAARLDGAGEFRSYLQIALPILRPGLAALGIYTFLSAWNSYLWPLMVLRGETSMTLTVGVAGMEAQAAGSATPFGEIMAAATLMSIPVIAVFVFVQRYFIAGLTAGAVKA